MENSTHYPSNIIEFRSRVAPTAGSIPQMIDGASALHPQFFPQELVAFEFEPQVSNPLKENIDHFDQNWWREGLPRDWFRLNKIGFTMNGQMDLLQGADYESKTLWLTQTRMDLLGYVPECLKQGVVFPFRYDTFDGVDFVDLRYGKRMMGMIDSKERGGVVLRTAEKMRDFLKDKDPGAVTIMASPIGETGLTNDDGSPIVYEALQMFIMKKNRQRGIEGVTLRTDFNMAETREIVEIYTGEKLPANAGFEEYMQAIFIDPELNMQFEEVAATLRDIRKRNQPKRADIAYDPKVKGLVPRTWEDMFYQLHNRESIYNIDEETTEYIDQFEEYVLHGDLTPFEIRKALAATILRISRHFFVKEKFQDAYSSEYVGSTENLSPGFTYGDAYEEAAERPGCAGGGSSQSSIEKMLGKERGYEFDHEGTCVVCEQGPRRLGPCEICEPCVEKIEKDEEMGIAA